MPTADDVTWTVVSLLVLALAAGIRPRRVVCPAGWHNMGVRSDGALHCHRDTADGPDLPGNVHGHIYCHAGEVPVVVDQRTVTCRAEEKRQ